MKNKIRVLLIDDYPSFALTKAAHTNLDNLRDNQKELDVPFISSKVDITGKLEDDNSNSMSPINVRINFVEEEEYSEYFELKWLRNKEDLQLYKKLCRITEDQFSSSGLGRIDGVVPEIVLFDYALTGHEDKSYLNEESDMNLLTQIVPIYRIKEFLLDEKKEIPTADNVSLDVSLIADGLNSDNIGCMGGIMTVSHFRNHVCIGLATSRKSDEHIQGQDVQFLESLVKEPYQFNFSLRGNIKNLTWKTLLTNSALMLRNRIKTLIQSSKITLDLTQLLEYAGGDVKPEQDKRIFTFQSVYGVRHLPLDGLFIDIDAENRKEAVQSFAKECLDIHLKNANSGLTKDIFDEAIKFARQLLEQYDNKDKFLKRIRFSQLKQKAENSTITADQQTDLNSIFSELGMEITAKEYKDAFDLRNYNGTNDNLVKRYAALFVMVAIYHRYVEFKKCNARENEFKGKPYLFTQPEKMDYLLGIYPRPSTPLILPLHGKADGLDNDLKRTTKRCDTDSKGLLINSVLNNIDDGGITKGERPLLQSYALGIGLNTGDFAEWFI